MNSITPEDAGTLLWPELTKGTLIRRYKRFLADVRLDDSRAVTVHCPNSGSMLECSEPGRSVYLSRHDNPARKHPYTWELIQMPGSLVGINTLVPNRLVSVSVRAGLVPQLRGYDDIRSEVKYGKNSRIDILLAGGGKACFVEIKNCTLVQDGMAFFPDAVTTRGRKHLEELQAEVRRGNRAVMFFLIQRMDAEVFAPAGHIDPKYTGELMKAVKCGVEIVCYDTEITLKAIRLRGMVPVHLDGSKPALRRIMPR
jgi:sugar fermentation stimulation protein A